MQLETEPKLKPQAVRSHQRLLLVLGSGLLGWLGGFVASAPAMMVVGWRDSEHSPRIFAATIGTGLLAWGMWTLALAACVWLLCAVPTALFVPPAFLVRCKARVLAVTLLVTVILITTRMYSFQDLGASRTILRFVLYMPYGAFALFFALVTAWWYIRGLARTGAFPVDAGPSR